MQLYSLTISGTTKETFTGLFEEMMANGRVTEALELLERMDNMFLDQNAEQTEAILLHACKQFKDKNLASFLVSNSYSIGALYQIRKIKIRCFALRMQ